MNAARVRRAAKTENPQWRLIVLGADAIPVQTRQRSGIVICRNHAEIGRELQGGPQRTVWVSRSASLTDALVKAVLERRLYSRKDARLLMLEAPRTESIPSLEALFGQAIGITRSFRWLPMEELVDVLTAPEEAKDLFIGGAADPGSEALTLVRGDLSMILAPFSLFQPSGDGTAPDFTRLAFADYGQTVMLGDYEAAADAILYDIDPDYRRALKQKRCREDRTFGASVRRLRKQRGLTQEGFAPLTARTIARIERNEVAEPRRKTLKIIADRLGVTPEEVADY